MGGPQALNRKMGRGTKSLKASTETQKCAGSMGEGRFISVVVGLGEGLTHAVVTSCLWRERRGI